MIDNIEHSYPDYEIDCGLQLYNFVCNKCERLTPNRGKRWFSYTGSSYKKTWHTSGTCVFCKTPTTQLIYFCFDCEISKEFNFIRSFKKKTRKSIMYYYGPEEKHNFWYYPERDSWKIQGLKGYITSKCLTRTMLLFMIEHENLFLIWKALRKFQGMKDIIKYIINIRCTLILKNNEF